MDAEVVVQLMISQQLLNEAIVATAQSSYHKNCLILQQLRLMNVQTLIGFCKMLQGSISQSHIGNLLYAGKFYV